MTPLGHGRRTTSMEPQAGHGTLTPGAPGGILTLNEAEQELQEGFISMDSGSCGDFSSVEFRSGSNAGGGASGSGSNAGGGASGSGSNAGDGASGSGSAAVISSKSVISGISGGIWVVGCSSCRA